MAHHSLLPPSAFWDLVPLQDDDFLFLDASSLGLETTTRPFEPLEQEAFGQFEWLEDVLRSIPTVGPNTPEGPQVTPLGSPFGLLACCELQAKLTEIECETDQTQTSEGESGDDRTTDFLWAIEMEHGCQVVLASDYHRNGVGSTKKQSKRGGNSSPRKAKSLSGITKRKSSALLRSSKSRAQTTPRKKKQQAEPTCPPTPRKGKHNPGSLVLTATLGLSSTRRGAPLCLPLTFPRLNPDRSCKRKLEYPDSLF